LEASYKDGLSTAEAADLAAKAVKAAMERDPNSGNGIQVLMIDEKGVEWRDFGGAQ
jgi:proteasome beta subunit